MTDRQEAERLFDEGDQFSTEGARALQQGKMQEGHEWFRKAIEAYETALDAAPEDDVLLVGNLELCIGARMYGLGDVDGAEARYEDVLGSLAGCPEIADGAEGTELFAQAKLNRAECRLAGGDAARARQEIEEVLELVPNHPYALMLLGRC